MKHLIRPLFALLLPLLLSVGCVLPVANLLVVPSANDWVKVPIALDPSVVDVGKRGEPNLETLTGLKPDLIITAAFRSAENYEQLRNED